MGTLELLLLLLAYGGVTGVLFFYEFKRLKSLSGHDHEGAETD